MLIPVTVIGLVAFETGWVIAIEIFAAGVFLLALLFPYTGISLNGKLVDFLYYTLAIIGIVLFSSSQLVEKSKLEIHMQLSHAIEELALNQDAKKKLDSLFTHYKPEQYNEEYEDWMDSPFLAQKSVVLAPLENEFYLNADSVQKLELTPVVAIQEFYADIDEKIAHTKSSIASAEETRKNWSPPQNTSIIYRLVELLVWPYILCLAFSLKIAKSRLI